MPPKPLRSKEVVKKSLAALPRPIISNSSLLYVPSDAVDGYQDRINSGVEWTALEEAARYHRVVFQTTVIPKHTFSEALRTKMKKSMLSGFLYTDTKMSLQDYCELIIPISLWDNDKFGTENAKIFFRSANSVTNNLPSLIKKTCKTGDRRLFRQALKKSTVLRLNDTNMTDIDEGLLEYKNLITLNLCGNFIEGFNGPFFPKTLMTLELQANGIKTIQSIADFLPNNLVYLGLSRNLLNDDGIPSLSSLPYQLTVLDISDNDIYDIVQVLTALAQLPNLVSLALSGNPCALCAGYARMTLMQLPRLRWLDYREVLPSDRPLETTEVHPDDLRSTYFYFTVLRVMSAPQPPKLDKGVTTTFHMELELPLLDSERRQFLMYRRQESLVEYLPEHEDGSLHSENQKTSNNRRMSTPVNLDAQSSHESDAYKFPVSKNSREVLHYRTFESNRVPWNKLMTFHEPSVKIFCPDLVALRDTFRTVVTARLVYTVTSDKPKPKEKEKKGQERKEQKEHKPAVEQRVVLAEIRCALKQPDWSQPLQHFHWDSSMKTKDAIHWGEGDLAVLQYTRSPKASQEYKYTLPEVLTVHLGFDIESLRQ